MSLCFLQSTSRYVGVKSTNSKIGKVVVEQWKFEKESTFLLYETFTIHSSKAGELIIAVTFFLQMLKSNPLKQMSDGTRNYYE